MNKKSVSGEINSLNKHPAQESRHKFAWEGRNLVLKKEREMRGGVTKKQALSQCLLEYGFSPFTVTDLTKVVIESLFL